MCSPWYAIQHLWWSRNGKSFRFLDLPREIRDMIYLFCIGSSIYPRSSYRDAIRLPLGCGRRTRDHNNVERPNLAIALANKQLYEEAMKAAWEDTVKCFGDAKRLKEFLRVCSSANRPHNLTMTFKLCFDHRQYLMFFGADMHEVDINPNYPSAGTIFPMMAALEVKELTLDFVSPKRWCNGAREPRDWVAQRPCQKVLVDWILRWAKRYLTVLPSTTSVRFAGFIKRSTKAEWEEILRQEQLHNPQTIDVEFLRNLTPPLL